MSKKIKSIEILRLKDMMQEVDKYGALSSGLAKLPLPDHFRIGFMKYNIPATLDDLSSSICYGQRIFLSRSEDNDFGAILRIIDGYYYPIVTGRKWDEEKALLFGNKVLNCMVKDLYPIAMHIIDLIRKMADRETKLLNREPSKIEQAAGIDKLSIFSELSAIDYLRTSMGITEEQVMLTPYDTCLVRFMYNKELAAYQERIYENMKK